MKGKNWSLLKRNSVCRLLLPPLALILILLFFTFSWLLSPFPSRGSDFYGAGTILLLIPLADILLPSFIPYWGLGTSFSFPKFSMGLLSFILHLLIPNHIMLWKFYFWLLFLVSGVFMYYYLLNHVDSSAISFLGATIYMYIPYHIAESIAEGHGLLSIAYALTPLLFLSYDKLYLKSDLKNTMTSGIITALDVLTHPQAFPLLTAPFLATYLLTRLILDKRPVSTKLKKATTLLSSTIYGLLLSSFWWIPFYRSMTHFYGTTYTIIDSLYFTADLIQAVTLQAMSVNISEWQSFFHNPWELLFSMITPSLLVLSMYSIFKKHNKTGISMFTAYILSLLLALGVTSPINVYYFAFNYIPLFNSIRTPVRFLFFTSFATTVIICIGLNNSFKNLKLSKKHIRIVLTLLLLLFMINSYTEINYAFQTFQLPATLHQAYNYLNTKPYGRIFIVPLSAWVHNPEWGNTINPMLWVFMYNKETVGCGAPNLLAEPTGELLDFLYWKAFSGKINLSVLCDIYGVDYIWVDKTNQLSENYNYLDPSMEKIFENEQYAIYQNKDRLPVIFLLYQCYHNISLNTSWTSPNESEIQVQPTTNGIIIFCNFNTDQYEVATISHNISLENYTLTDELAFNYNVLTNNNDLPSKIRLKITLIESNGNKYTINTLKLDKSGTISIPLFLFQPCNHTDTQLDTNYVSKIQIEIREAATPYQAKSFAIECSDFKIIKNTFKEVPFLRINSNVYILWLNSTTEEQQYSKKYIVLNYAYFPNWELTVINPKVPISVASKKVLYLLNGFDITTTSTHYVTYEIHFNASVIEKGSIILSAITFCIAPFYLFYTHRRKIYLSLKQFFQKPSLTCFNSSK